MSMKAAPFYWIECDGNDCDSRCPSRHDDAVAWQEQGQAEDYALDGDWTHTADGLWLCDLCSIERIDDE